MTLSVEERTEIRRAVEEALAAVVGPYAAAQQKILTDTTTQLTNLARADMERNGQVGRLASLYEAFDSRLRRLEELAPAIIITRDRTLEIHQQVPALNRGLTAAIGMATTVAGKVEEMGQRLQSFIDEFQGDVLGIRQTLNTRLEDLLFRLDAATSWLEGKSEGMKGDIDELKKWREERTSAAPQAPNAKKNSGASG